MTTCCLLTLISGYQLNWAATIYNTIRPLTLNDGGYDCLQQLKEQGIKFEHLGLIKSNQCTIKNAVRIKHFPETRLSSSITVSCTTAKNLHHYFKEIQANSISHLGSYNCRSIRNSGFTSEHGFGTAIDISSINGALVAKDWNADTQQGKTLKKANDIAHQYFSNVLSPNTDIAHQDHMHLDLGFGY